MLIKPLGNSWNKLKEDIRKVVELPIKCTIEQMIWNNYCFLTATWVIFIVIKSLVLGGFDNIVGELKVAKSTNRKVQKSISGNKFKLLHANRNISFLI